MENTKNYFDAWLNVQQNLFDGFVDNAKKAQQLFLDQTDPKLAGNFGGLQNLYSTWTNAVLNSWMAAGDQNQAVKENLSKFVGGSNVYLKLFDLWQPFMQAARERSVNAEAYKDFLDPLKYKELLDQVFGFDPEAAKSIMAQATELLNLYSSAGQQFSQPWAEALAAYPHFAKGHPESFIKTFHSLFNAFDSTIGRIFHVPPVGKDREKIELLLRGIDELSVYTAKNIEYQHTMYLTGMTAMEKVVEKLAEKLKSGEEIKQFDEFFDIWIDVSEQSYYALFKTEEFSKLQGELLDAALTVKKSFAKIMEFYLQDFPIVLRSEVEDLYQTVYDLKKRLKKLEKQNNEAQA